MRSLDRGGYPIVAELTGESGRSEDLRTEELADVLRSSLRAEYADANDKELRDALENVFDAMSLEEAFSFRSALSQARKSISRLAADPAFRDVVRTAVPIVGGAPGTIIAGPVGTAVGTLLGNLAASALAAPAEPAPPPARPPAAPPSVTAVTPAPTAPSRVLRRPGQVSLPHQRLPLRAMTRWSQSAGPNAGRSYSSTVAQDVTRGGIVITPDPRDHETPVDTNLLRAAALGACEGWGLRSDCVLCRGYGSAGWTQLDPELFEEFVRPAIAKLSDLPADGRNWDGGVKAREDGHHHQTAQGVSHE